MVAAIIEWKEKAEGRTLTQILGEEADSRDGRIIRKRAKCFVIKNRILYHKWDNPNESQPIFQYVVPKDLRAKALRACHENAGHQGKERTLSLLKDRFWWPAMDTAVKTVVEQCRRCVAFSASPQKAGLRPILVTAPGELLHVDYTSVELDINPGVQPRSANILVICDHFTRHVMAFITKDQTARTAAEILWHRYFAVFGLPARILTDQGLNFESTLFEELCRLMNATKLRTSPHRPQCNGQVERAHQTLIRMLGKLQGKDKEEWTRHLDELVFAYNCTRSGITGFSPYFLMFGRRPRLPVDYIFPTMPLDPKHKPRSQYVAELQATLKEAFAKAEAASQGEAARQKRYFDRRTNAAVLAPGDLILVRVLNYKGKRKLIDRWEEKPSRVVTRLGPDSPVYEICDLDDPNRRRRYHRNHLYLIKLKEGTEMVPNTSDDPKTPNPAECHTDGGNVTSTSQKKAQVMEEVALNTPTVSTDSDTTDGNSSDEQEADEGSSVDPIGFPNVMG
jgi:transposase InsO family protein